MSRSRATAALCTTGILLGAVAAFGAGAAAATPIQSTTATALAASHHRPAPTCGGHRPAKPGGGLYTCTFTDEFTKSTLDTSKWTVGTTADAGFTTGSIVFGARDCYLNNGHNVSVSGGQLHLTSRALAQPLVCHSPLGDFRTNRTAGSVLSHGKFAQTYGRFEFRARFPSTTMAGVDSALWMYPQNPAYGAWPRSGEIDVAEWFGSRYADHVLPSVHYSGENKTLSTGRDCVVPTADSKFHTYAVAWTKTTMYFYYDNQLCFQHAWTPAARLVAPQPFDKAFSLVMTQTGGQNAPIGTSTTMDVAWVRAWK
jgi:beta-glucanase (GH16 family)